MMYYRAELNSWVAEYIQDGYSGAVNHPLPKSKECSFTQSSWTHIHISSHPAAAA